MSPSPRIADRPGRGWAWGPPNLGDSAAPQLGRVRRDPACRVAKLPIGLLSALLTCGLVAACDDPTPIPPRSPASLIGTAPPQAGLPIGATASPSPVVTPSPGPTQVVPPPEPLSLPPGFGIGIFARLDTQPGAMAVAPNGDVFVSAPRDGRILVLPDRNADGVADGGVSAVGVFANGLNRPYGLGFIEGWLYVAATDAVLRYPYRDGDLLAAGPAELIADLPSEGDHWARPLAFDPDGRLYVGVGASCNVCEETDARRAAVLQMQADGSAAKLYSAGLRSPLGFAFHPETGDVWTGDRGREGLGEEKPPDELNRLSPGGHSGWPHCWGKQQHDPQLRGARSFCGSTVAPMVELDAQSGVGGMLFYQGRNFPESYRGDLYVALNGSATRRGLPTGYSIVRIPFNGWAPRGEVFAFAEGWLRPDTRRWGSPVDLAMAKDGALLVSDDGGSLIYRIFFAGEPSEGEAESP